MDSNAKTKTTNMFAILGCFVLAVSVIGLGYKVYQWRKNARAERRADRQANREANQARFKEMANDLKLTKQQLASILDSNVQKQPFDKAAQEAMTKQSSDLLDALNKYIKDDSTQDKTTQEDMQVLKNLIEQQKTLINDLKNTAVNDKGKLDNINTDQKKVMEGIAALVKAQIDTQGVAKVQLEGLLFVVNLFVNGMAPEAMAEATELINNNKKAKDCITITQSNLKQIIELYNKLLSEEQKSIEKLEADIVGLGKTLSGLETALSNEQTTLSDLVETALPGLQAELSGLETALLQEQKTLSDLTNKEAALPQEKKSVEKKIEWTAHELNIAIANMKQGAAQSYNEGLSLELKAELLKLEKTLLDLTNLPQEKESVQRKIEEIERQIKDITSQIESTNESISKSNTSIKSLNAQIESTNTEIKSTNTEIELDKRQKSSIEPMSKIAQEIFDAMNSYATNDNITNEGFFDYFDKFYATLTKKYENEISAIVSINKNLNPLQDGDYIMEANALMKDPAYINQINALMKLPAVLILKLKRDIEAKIAQLSQ